MRSNIFDAPAFDFITNNRARPLSDRRVHQALPAQRRFFSPPTFKIHTVIEKRRNSFISRSKSTGWSVLLMGLYQEEMRFALERARVVSHRSWSV